MIKSRFHSFFVAASVLLCVVSSVQAQGKVLLRVHLQPGQTFDQGFAMEMKILHITSREHTDITQVTHLKVHNQVLGVDNDGTMKVKVTFQVVEMKNSEITNGKVRSNLEYDSAKPPKEISPDLRSTSVLVGQSVIITVLPKGKIVKVEGADAIAQRMAAGIKSPDQRVFLTGIFKRAVESMSGQTVGMMNFAPELVAPGDSWTMSDTSPTATSQLSSGQYTLMSIKDNIATIAVKSTSKPNPDAPPPGKNISDIGALGRENGVIHVDTKSGLISDFEIHLRSSGPIPPPDKSISTQSKAASAWTLLKIDSESIMRGWTVQLPR